MDHLIMSSCAFQEFHEDEFPEYQIFRDLLHFREKSWIPGGVTDSERNLYEHASEENTCKFAIANDRRFMPSLVFA